MVLIFKAIVFSLKQLAVHDLESPQVMDRISGMVNQRTPTHQETVAVHMGQDRPA
jgi:hypothetical protein